VQGKRKEGLTGEERSRQDSTHHDHGGQAMRKPKRTVRKQPGQRRQQREQADYGKCGTEDIPARTRLLKQCQ
jgi:hypothetical protein